MVRRSLTLTKMQNFSLHLLFWTSEHLLSFSGKIQQRTIKEYKKLKQILRKDVKCLPLSSLGRTDRCRLD